MLLRTLLLLSALLLLLCFLLLLRPLLLHMLLPVCSSMWYICSPLLQLLALLRSYNMALRTICLPVYLCHRSFGRFPMVETGELSPVLHSVLLMRHLRTCWLYMSLPGIRLLLGSWPGIYAPSAIIANMVGSIVNNRSVNIGVVDNSTINIYYCCVITETVSAPAASVKSVTPIAVTIVNATIKTYMRSPVTCVKTIIAIIITPIWRSPVQTRIRWCYPNPRYPIIAIIIIIGPIAGLP